MEFSTKSIEMAIVETRQIALHHLGTGRTACHAEGPGEARVLAVVHQDEHDHAEAEQYLEADEDDRHEAQSTSTWPARPSTSRPITVAPAGTAPGATAASRPPDVCASQASAASSASWPSANVA